MQQYVDCYAPRTVNMRPERDCTRPRLQCEAAHDKMLDTVREYWCTPTRRQDPQRSQPCSEQSVSPISQGLAHSRLLSAVLDGVRHYLEPDNAVADEVVCLVIFYQEAQVVEQEPVPVIVPVPHRETVARLPACKVQGHRAVFFFSIR